MWWKKTAKPLQHRGVAYYRHSAQDRQENSVAIQREQVRKFAAEHGIEIIREFADRGKSGLSTEGRDEFKRMLEMVFNTSIQFEYVLVLDMNRWGRFQDLDLSGYYRALCKQYGRTVIYTSMGFQKDDDPMYYLWMHVEGMRAAAYSAELSKKVFLGCKKIAEQGYRAGGPPPYGTRRMLLDEQRNPVQHLQRGQHKSIQNQRVTLVPGEKQEQEVVRRIYREFAQEEKDPKKIAEGLNRDGIPSPGGKLWKPGTIDHILGNEIYIGTMVYNKTASRLQSKPVKNPKESWVRTPNAFCPVVDQKIFTKVQLRKAEQQEEYERRHSTTEMVHQLKSLYEQRGYISARQIASRPTMLGPQVYAKKFRSLDMAFQNLFPEVIRQTRAEVVDFLKLSTEKVDEQEDFVILNDSFSVLIQPSVPVPFGYGGYWSFLPDSRMEIDVTLGVPLSNTQDYHILGYMAFPRILTKGHKIRVYGSSESPIQLFGYQGLEFIQALVS